MKDERNPRISVVIPCHNGSAELEYCLASLARSPLEQMECIVVDDGSTDDCSGVVLRAPLPVRLIRMEVRRGAAAARNAGARSASGNILVFLDADVCVHPNTLSLIAEAFAENRGLGAVMGSYDDSPSAAGFHSQFRNLLHCYVHRTARREASTFWSGCGAVRRDIFWMHGGFDESPGGIDDVELGGRLVRAGVRIELRPQIQVQHRKQWTFLLWTKTDIWLRGIPWTLIVLRDRRMPNTLNLTYRNRLSVALVCMAVVAIAAAVVNPKFAFLGMSLLGTAAWANRPLYRFLRERRGTVFAARSTVAHLLHLFICGLSFLLGIAIFAFSSAHSGSRTRSGKNGAVPANLPVKVAE